jgi:hypothetical protein
MLEAIFWSVEEIAAEGKRLYFGGIRQLVETEYNRGKMLTIDVETGDYKIDSANSDLECNLLKTRSYH